MRNNCSGRTLIETLSVLAVVGILSVSVLQLYAKAMNTVRANYLMEQVFIKASEFIESPVANRLGRGKMVDVSVYMNEKLSYGYSFCRVSEVCAPKQEEGEIIIKVNGFFPISLCKMLKKKIQTEEYPALKNIKANMVDLSDNDCPWMEDIISMTFIIDSEFKK